MVEPSRTRSRQIGPIGTVARVVIGTALVAFGLVGGQVTVMHGQVRTGFQPLSLIVGLVVFPVALLAWQGMRARLNPTRLIALGPIATILNIAVFFGLVLTLFYAPTIGYLGGAALVFYGASMLLAALRGYAGCEVLALSNWLLRRDDQIGCLFLSLVDNIESGLKNR